MNLKTTAGEPISTSRKQLPDVEPGASVMASRAANLQCRTGGVAYMAGSAPALALPTVSNVPAGRTGSTGTTRPRRSECGGRRQQYRLLCQLIAAGNEDDVLDLISST